MSLGVLLHPEHHLKVEACRVCRTCRVIDLGSIKLSSADGHGTQEVIPEVQKSYLGSEYFRRNTTNGWSYEVELRPLNSQMPRHLISDVHEGMNEIPIVHGSFPANPQLRKRAWADRRKKKTLLNWTL